MKPFWKKKASKVTFKTHRKHQLLPKEEQLRRKTDEKNAEGTK
jgi:hypothetical protein